MKTYTVILSITTKFGDPNTWDWTTLLDGEQVRVEHTHSVPPIRKHMPRDTERDTIVSTVNAMGKPLTTSEIASLSGLDNILTARLVFELKRKGRLHEAGRNATGDMTYRVR
jgi:hypothetical protein